MRYISIIIIAAFVFFISGCKEESVQVDMYFHISGSVDNEDIKTVYLVHNEEVQNYDSYKKAIDSCIVDSSGVYKFSFITDTAGFYQLRDEQQNPLYFGFNIYMEPNDTLIIHKKNDEERTHLSGNAAYLNNYFWNEKDNNALTEKEQDEFYSRFYMSTDELLLYMEELKNRDLNFMNAYFTNYNIPEKYKQYLQASINLQYVNTIFGYMNNKMYYDETVEV